MLITITELESHQDELYFATYQEAYKYAIIFESATMIGTMMVWAASSLAGALCGFQ